MRPIDEFYFLKIFSLGIRIHNCRDERKEQLATSMAAKQKKRTDNIAARHDRKDKHKTGKNKARPGFEGKSFGKGNKGKGAAKGGKK